MDKETLLNSLKITFKEIEYWTDYKKNNFTALFEECTYLDKIENEYLFLDNENHKYIYYIIEGDVVIELNNSKNLEFDVIHSNLNNMMSTNLEYFKRIIKKPKINKGVFANLVKGKLDVNKNEKNSIIRSNTSTKAINKSHVLEPNFEDNNEKYKENIILNKNILSINSEKKLKTNTSMRNNIDLNQLEEIEKTSNKNFNDIYLNNFKKQKSIKNEISNKYVKELHSENVQFFVLNNLENFRAFMIGEKVKSVSDIDEYYIIDYSSRLCKINEVSSNSWLNIETILTEKDKRKTKFDNEENKINNKEGKISKKIKWIKSSSYLYNTIYCAKLKTSSNKLLRISINNFLKCLYYFNSNSLKIIGKIIFDRVLNLRNIINKNSNSNKFVTSNITFREKMFQIFNYKYEVKKVIDVLKNTENKHKDNSIESNFKLINKMKNRLVKTRSAKVRYDRFGYLNNEDNKIEVVADKFINVNNKTINNNYIGTNTITKIEINESIKNNKNSKNTELFNLFEIDDLKEFYNNKMIQKEYKESQKCDLNNNTAYSEKQKLNIINYTEDLNTFNNMNEVNILNLSIINPDLFIKKKNNVKNISKGNKSRINSNSVKSSIDSKKKNNVEENNLLIEKLSKKYVPYHKTIINSINNDINKSSNEYETLTTNIDSFLDDKKNMKQRNVNFPYVISESNNSLVSKKKNNQNLNKNNRNIILSNINESSNLKQISSNILITGKI